MKKILLVDDEPNIIMTLEYTFKKQNMEVFIARDGEEAIAILEKETPNVVVLDVMMPKVDGFETLAYIKSQPKLFHCKVLFLSAKNKEQDIQKGLDAGADGYFTKPFSIKKLVEQVNHLLNL
jgi:two-component system, OmpR family, alkaline phosphatase synthesis response regulator PhoP